ncbi:MAG: hypothetical protein Kow0042_18100 [Calditrichia bacterium]
MKRTLSIISLLGFGIYLLSCQQNASRQEEGSALGSAVHVSLSVKNIRESKIFYQKLGFRELEGRDSGEHPWAVLSDGSIFLMLSQNPFPSPALTYYASDMDNRVQKFQEKGIRFEDIITREGRFSAAVLKAPNGPGLSLIRYDSQALPLRPPVHSFRFGEFARIDLPTANFEATKQFFTRLGFHILTDTPEPDRFALLTDGLITIGIHPNFPVPTPVLTYETDEWQNLPSRLAAEKIPFTAVVPQNQMESTGILLESPDGQVIFLQPKTKEPQASNRSIGN